LQRNRFISSFIAGLLVMLTLLSITPKHLLHDVFADHIDKKDVCPHPMDAGFHQSYHGCDTANFVVETPFTTTQAFVVIAPVPFDILAAVRYYPTGPIASIGYCSLRGPPSAV
jgi:hypothetical protein